MRDELRKALNATKGLTTEELGTLRSHISALLALGPSSQDQILTASNHDDWVLMGIVDYMRASDLDPSGVAQLTSGKHYDAFRAKLPTIHRWLKRSGTQVQQRAVLRLGIGLLHQNLQAMNIAVSSRLMMAHIHRLPSVINKEFPGYAENGLLGLIFRSERHVRKKQSRKPV